MSNYLVEIQYRKGPEFSSNVTANTEAIAKTQAAALAKQCGWDQPVKKIIAKRQEIQGN